MSIRGFVFGLITGAGITIITKAEIREKISTYFGSFDRDQVTHSVKAKFTQLSEKLPIQMVSTPESTFGDEFPVDSETSEVPSKQTVGATTGGIGSTAGFTPTTGITGEDSSSIPGSTDTKEASIRSKSASSRTTSTSTGIPTATTDLPKV